MQTIRQCYVRLREMSRFYEKYSNYDLNDGKVHILYVCPTLEHKSYYGIILPALELNKTPTHCAIMTSIGDKGDKKPTHCIDDIDVRLLQWAHYIVFPTALTCLKYTILVLRKLYPYLKIGMYLDDNYHKIPVWHTQYQETNSKAQGLLLENLNLLDFSICQNEQLANQYNAALEFYYTQSPCHIYTIPALTSTISFENLDVLPYKADKPLTVGIFMPSKTFSDYLPTLMEQLQGHNIQANIIIYGDMCPKTSNIDMPCIRYHRSLGFFDYFKELQQSQLTMALFPTSEYTEYQSVGSYLDIACLGIPAILCARHPAVNLIQTEKNGLVVNTIHDWHLAIFRLIDTTLQKKLKTQALRIVWKYHSFTTETIKHLTTVFK